jgi:hypothetical protein
VTAVRDALRRQAETSAFLRDLDLAGRVRITPAGIPVAAIGAALLVPAWPAGSVDGVTSGTGDDLTGDLGRVAP